MSNLKQKRNLKLKQSKKNINKAIPIIDSITSDDEVQIFEQDDTEIIEIK